MSYAHTVTVTLGYEQAVQKIKKSLAEQGFGILSEVDIKSISRPNWAPQAPTPSAIISSSVPAAPRLRNGH